MGALKPERRVEPPPTGVEGGTSLVATLRRTLREFNEDGMTDWAAALTYYALLSAFPALIAVSSMVGLFADADTLTTFVLDVAPPSAADALAGPIESVTSSAGRAGTALALGLAGALWGASGYTSAFGRAVNVVFEVREGRPFWRLRPTQLAVTVANVLLLTVVVLVIVLSGPVVAAVAEPMGLGDTALRVWSFAKWPLLLAAAITLIASLYGLTPNVRQHGLRAVLPGALIALALWAVATAGFALYTANLGSYDRTTARWAGSSCCWSGCGCRTSPCCWAPSSTPNVSAPARSRPACPVRVARSSCRCASTRRPRGAAETGADVSPSLDGGIARRAPCAYRGAHEPDTWSHRAVRPGGGGRRGPARSGVGRHSGGRGSLDPRAHRSGTGTRRGGRRRRAGVSAFWGRGAEALWAR